MANNLPDTKIYDIKRVQEVIDKMPCNCVTEEVTLMFKALADHTRLRIIFSIMDNELTVGDICNVVGMTKSAVSHQLKTLKDNRLVKSRKVGKQVFYSLDDEHVVILIGVVLEHIKHIDEDHCH